MSEGALKQVVLEGLESVELVEERLRQQVGAALVGLSSRRERNAASSSMRTAGEGERVVRVAYVIEVHQPLIWLHHPGRHCCPRPGGAGAVLDAVRAARRHW